MGPTHLTLERSFFLLCCSCCTFDEGHNFLFLHLLPPTAAIDGALHQISPHLLLMQISPHSIPLWQLVSAHNTLDEDILFPLRIRSDLKNKEVIAAVTQEAFQSVPKDENWLWHLRFGHLNFGGLNLLSRKGMVRGLPLIEKPDSLCEGCILGKQHRESFPSGKSIRAKAPTRIMCDNQSCIKLSENLVFHDRSKHIDFQCHFVKDCVQRGAVQLTREELLKFGGSFSMNELRKDFASSGRDPGDLTTHVALEWDFKPCGGKTNQE